MSDATWGSICPQFAFSATGLSPPLAGLSSPVPVRFPADLRWPRNPARVRRHGRFRLVPFRSPLLRESLLLSFPRATKMYHFARSAFAPYTPPCGGASDANVAASAATGCPIRRSRDLSLFGGSSGLIAAFHVRHRSLAPRHPPCALGSLALDSSLPRLSWWHSPLTPLPIHMSKSTSETTARPPGGGPEALSEPPSRGGRSSAGTTAFSMGRPGPQQLALSLVEMTGIEPATSDLQSQRSPS